MRGRAVRIAATRQENTWRRLRESGPRLSRSEVPPLERYKEISQRVTLPRRAASGDSYVGPSLAAPTNELCDVGHATLHFRASVCTSIKWGQ